MYFLDIADYGNILSVFIEPYILKILNLFPLQKPYIIF